MIIDMRIIPDGHTTLTGTTDLESVKADLPEIIEKVSYIAEIDRTGSTAFVHVTFKGVFEIECARCLNNFSLSIGSDFRVIIKEKSAASDGDEADFYYDVKHDQVDISSAFFDEIMIAIPLMPLCAETCKGIEISGLNDISVVKDSIDPRWDALKKLKLNG